jgi:hypothetical protein
MLSVRISEAEICSVYEYQRLIYAQCTNIRGRDMLSVQISEAEICSVYEYQRPRYSQCTNIRGRDLLSVRISEVQNLVLGHANYPIVQVEEVDPLA